MEVPLAEVVDGSRCIGFQASKVIISHQIHLIPGKANGERTHGVNRDNGKMTHGVSRENGKMRYGVKQSYCCLSLPDIGEKKTSEIVKD